MAHSRAKDLCWVCLLILGLGTSGQVARAQTNLPLQDELRYRNAYLALQNVRRLRLQGREKEVPGILVDMLRDYTRDEGIIRRVYVDLVFSLMEMDRTSEAEGIAQESLLRYPDLRAGAASYPPKVNQFYDRIRGQMFGSFTLHTEPSSCEAYLGTLRLGSTPLVLGDIPVGQHQILLTHDGYGDKLVTLDIAPGRHTVLELPLARPDASPRGNIRPGVDLGLSYVFLAYTVDPQSDLVDNTGQFRFSVGGFIDFAIKPNLFLTPGLRWARLGNKATFGVTAPVERKTVQEYVTMPLLLKLFPFSSNGVFFTGGLEIGVLTKAEQTQTGTSGTQALFPKDYNLALDLGAGYEEPALGHMGFVHLQFSLGLPSAFGNASTDWRTAELKLSTGFTL